MDKRYLDPEDEADRHGELHVFLQFHVGEQGQRHDRGHRLEPTSNPRQTLVSEWLLELDRDRQRGGERERQMAKDMYIHIEVIILKRLPNQDKHYFFGGGRGLIRFYGPPKNVLVSI